MDTPASPCQSTELVQLRAERDAARTRYAEFYDSAPFGSCTLGPQGTILEANLTLASLLGRSKADLVAWPLANFIAREDQAHFHRCLQRLKETGRPQRTEGRLLEEGGFLTWVALEATAARDEAGGRVVRVVLNDIHGRKQAEEAHQESEERFKAIFEGSPDAIFIWPEGGPFLIVNATAVARYGYSQEKFKTLYPQDLVPPRRQEPGTDLLRASVWSERPAPWVHRKKDGTEFPVELLIKPFLLQGAPCLYMAARDITQRQQVQHRLERFNRTRELILECTQAIIRASTEPELLHEFCRICLGVQGIQQAWVGRMDHDPARSVRLAAVLGAPEDAWDQVRISWANDAFGQGPAGVAIRTGKACLRTGDHAGLKLGEPWHDAGATLALPLTAGHQTFGTLVLQAHEAEPFDDQDVELFMEVANNLSIGLGTLRSRMERDQALAQAERLAEQLRALALELAQTEQRERLRLAHVLHDNLQQLLVGATFAIETLSSQIKGEPGRKSLEKLSETLQQAIHLSRVLTVELSPPAVLEKGLAASLEWLGRHVCESHGLKVALHLEGAVEPAAEPVRLFIFEAVQEILLNVVKHAKVGKARVRIRTLASQAIEVTVEDKGVGFDPAALEPDRFTGEGLGLFSLRERLRFLKGSLEIQSQPGHGSRFTLIIPTLGWPTDRAALPAPVMNEGDRAALPAPAMNEGDRAGAKRAPRPPRASHVGSGPSPGATSAL